MLYAVCAIIHAQHIKKKLFLKIPTEIFILLWNILSGGRVAGECEYGLSQFKNSLNRFLKCISNPLGKQGVSVNY